MTDTETGSLFGEVLAGLMEKHGIPATPENMYELAADSGLDPEAFMARVGGDTDVVVGYLTSLADALDLSVPEKTALAVAYALEQRS
jgi:hypothetical protein